MIYIINITSFLISTDSSYLFYDAKRDSHLDPFTMKLILDDKLHQLQNSHVAVINNIEAIPGNASMILHGYCDNDNAPYKQVCLVKGYRDGMWYCEVGKDEDTENKI